MWDFSKVSTKGLQRDEFLENDYKIVSLKNKSQTVSQIFIFLMKNSLKMDLFILLFSFKTTLSFLK
jgi:hypothetical protein